jgi:hypothetical protein
MSARIWSLWTATFENADRIAAHDRNELSALRMLHPAHQFQALPVPGHLARLAARPNRLVPKQLPEVAGERRVEAKLSNKLAESLPVDPAQKSGKFQSVAYKSINSFDPLLQLHKPN